MPETYAHASQPVVVTADQPPPQAVALPSSHVTTVEIVIGQPSFGDAVVAELQATGTLYTVPANKTLKGFIVIEAAATGSGTVTVTDANSVVQAELAFTGATEGTGPRAQAVSIAGGGGGNALTLATSGSVALISAAVAGYVK